MHPIIALIRSVIDLKAVSEKPTVSTTDHGERLKEFCYTEACQLPPLILVLTWLLGLTYYKVGKKETGKAQSKWTRKSETPKEVNHTAYI